MIIGSRSDMEMLRCHGTANGVQWSLVKVTALTSHVTCVFVLKSASCIWSLSPSNMKFHIGGMGNLTTLCADHRWHCAHFSSLCFLLTLFPSHFVLFSLCNWHDFPHDHSLHCTVACKYLIWPHRCLCSHVPPAPQRAEMHTRMHKHISEKNGETNDPCISFTCSFSEGSRHTGALACYNNHTVGVAP